MKNPIARLYELEAEVVLLKDRLSRADACVTALRKRNAELLAALTQVRDWDDDRQKLGQMAMPPESRAVIDHAILAAAKGEPS